MGTGDHQHDGATTVHCAECNSSSGLYWQGWRAYRIDDPEIGEARVRSGSAEGLQELYLEICVNHAV